MVNRSCEVFYCEKIGWKAMNSFNMVRGPIFMYRNFANFEQLQFHNLSTYQYESFREHYEWCSSNL